MANQKLLEHIRDQLERGISKELIRQNLVVNGWKEEDTDAVFKEVEALPKKEEKKEAPKPQPTKETTQPEGKSGEAEASPATAPVLQNTPRPTSVTLEQLQRLTQAALQPTIPPLNASSVVQSTPLTQGIPTQSQTSVTGTPTQAVVAQPGTPSTPPSPVQPITTMPTVPTQVTQVNQTASTVQVTPQEPLATTSNTQIPSQQIVPPAIVVTPEATEQARTILKGETMQMPSPIQVSVTKEILAPQMAPQPQPTQPSSPTGEQPLQATPTPKKKWVKWAMIIIGAILFLVIALVSVPFFLGMSSSDTAIVNDADIKLQKLDFSESDNSYLDIVKIDKKVLIPEDKKQGLNTMLQTGTVDPLVVSDLATQNAEALTYLHDATYKTRYQSKLYTDPNKIDLSKNETSLLKQLDQLVLIQLAQALAFSKEGKESEALELIFAPLVTLQQMQASQLLIDDATIVLDTKIKVLQTLERVIGQKSLTGSSTLASGDLIEYAYELNNYYSDTTSLLSGFKGEYQLAAKQIDDTYFSGLKVAAPFLNNETFGYLELVQKDYYFQPNKTKSLFLEAAKQRITALSKPCSQIEKESLKLLETESLLEENVIGNAFYMYYQKPRDAVLKKRCYENFLVATAQVLMAVKAYKIDTGSYPTTLDALVPTYLTAVPADPFTNKPLLYATSTMTISSEKKDLEKTVGGTLEVKIGF